MQIFGTIAGAVLVYMMGVKAIMGAGAALILGLATYKIYGQKQHQLRNQNEENIL